MSAAEQTAGTGRARARRTAMELLFEAEARGRSVAELAANIPADAPPYTSELLTGLAAGLAEVDATISGRLRPDWPLDRLGGVERAVLRIATWELTIGGVPPEIAIDEAVTLTRRFASEAAGKLINGVLGAIARELQEDGA